MSPRAWKENAIKLLQRILLGEWWPVGQSNVLEEIGKSILSNAPKWLYNVALLYLSTSKICAWLDSITCIPFLTIFNYIFVNVPYILLWLESFYGRGKLVFIQVHYDFKIQMLNCLFWIHYFPTIISCLLFTRLNKLTFNYYKHVLPCSVLIKSIYHQGI